MNKRGGDKVISMYWFLILVIVAGGVVLMTNSFYGSPYDVRGAEAEILATKVADCIYFGGKINGALFSGGVFKEEFRDNFMERCSLDFSPENELKPMEYYLSVDFLDRGNKGSSRFFIEEGNINFRKDCEIKSKKSEDMNKCVHREFWVGEGARIFLVKINSVVNKVEQNE